MFIRLAVILKQHLVDQELEALGNDRSKPEWVFCNEMGLMLGEDADNLRHRVFYKLLEKTGLRRIGCTTSAIPSPPGC